ncbi:type VII secretion protein EccC [Mycobacterium sp. CBMA 234]|uniref:type VII secretion protein EccCa n=1 Tax=Mycolicibacterium sp. CBMA 234 TaxID=1918495 RepID=UPI0012DEB9D1|nr:type VII secretion protein EccCa [Mycolicibacterium sp. CBMA 234]MUL64085.1 type VII secretion protein EccC [Mycolicibacterium sp. CBMA 234]
MEFTRVVRPPAVGPADGDIDVRTPPQVPRLPPGSLITRLVPVLMLLAMAGMLVFYFRSGSATGRNPMFLLFPAMMVLSMIGSTVLGSRGARRAGEVDADRREYLVYLEAIGDCADRTAMEQHAWLHENHPGPDGLWTVAGSNRMWQRRPDDEDFAEVRVGIGDARLSTRLVTSPVAGDGVTDPLTASALDRLLQTHASVPGVPVTVVVSRYRRLDIGGDGARSLLRAMVCQLAVWHGPDQVKIAAVTGSAGWDWLKWLPHHYHSGVIGRAALRFSDVSGVPTIPGCHLVVLADSDVSIDFDPSPGVTVLVVGEQISSPSLRVHAGELTATGVPELPPNAVADGLTAAQSEICARRLARYRLAGSPDDARQHEDWSALLSVADEGVRWQGRTSRHRLRVPIGTDGTGATVELDLKEPAEHGMGPHGLCIGATGSGKSEFLRTLTLGLISTHSPDELNLILVDFKGGATFLGFEKANHVAAVITNLAQEAHLVARMRDALAGEMTRRQGLLRAAGNLSGIGEYRRAREAGADLAPLPALFIVVDEFSELLSQHPDFAELFVAIGRLGRSLGIHLLLASQRLDEGRLRGLETHLSYRVCLKTFSAAESRAAIGVIDAHELPGTPGAGLLRTADGNLVRFHTAFVSGPVRISHDDDQLPSLFTIGVAPMAQESPAGPTLLSTTLNRLVGQGALAHQVWLPPLVGSPMLADLVATQPPGDSLQIPIGLVDNPFQQRRDLLVVDLSGAGGHVAVVGGPRSGKSTALQTLLLSMCATATATATATSTATRRLSIYGLDLGDGALMALRHLPHVGTVARRHEPELLRRIVSQLSAVCRRRQDFRQQHGPAVPFPDDYGEIILAVDGWSALRRESDALEDSITALVAQGLSVGVHVVLTASRWAELRPMLKDHVGTRIELRLGDPAESEMDRRRAQLLANCPPGRGLTKDGKEFVVALPQLDGSAVDCAPRAPAIELLPLQMAYAELASAAGADRPRHVIGVSEEELRPFTLDFGAYLILLGDTGCGKTATLRTLCRAMVDQTDPDQAQLLIVDFRRTLLGVVEPPHLCGYAMSTITTAAELTAVLALLEARLPGPGITQQLRDRSWWSGPDIYVVVDDYDLVAGAAGNPLSPLLDLLPHASDIGLHVIIARRSGGAARALFDPLLSRMQDLGATGMVMSTSPDEGVLLGTVRPMTLPPGRAVVVRRGQPDQLVQIAWTDPP